MHDYTDVRFLSLHRFVEAELTDQACWVSPDSIWMLTSKKVMSISISGDSIDMELLIDEEVAIHLRESKLTENQQLMPLSSGQSLFNASVRDTGQLHWSLLGFADQLEILKPEALRLEFKQKTVRMAGKYLNEIFE